jgi:hypothetical protein
MTGGAAGDAMERAQDRVYLCSGPASRGASVSLTIGWGTVAAPGAGRRREALWLVELIRDGKDLATRRTLPEGAIPEAAIVPLLVREIGMKPDVLCRAAAGAAAGVID